LLAFRPCAPRHRPRGRPGQGGGPALRLAMDGPRPSGAGNLDGHGWL